MHKILLVDDDPHIRKLISLYLKNEGFEIVEASDGREALKYLETTVVGLVLLDIMMPHIDGWELCRILREDWDIPVLMISAKGEDEDRIKGFQLGSDDYLVKPFNPIEMVMRV